MRRRDQAATVIQKYTRALQVRHIYLCGCTLSSFPVIPPTFLSLGSTHILLSSLILQVSCVYYHLLTGSCFSLHPPPSPPAPHTPLNLDLTVSFDFRSLIVSCFSFFTICRILFYSLLYSSALSQSWHWFVVFSPSFVCLMVVFCNFSLIFVYRCMKTNFFPLLSHGLIHGT